MRTVILGTADCAFQDDIHLLPFSSDPHARLTSDMSCGGPRDSATRRVKEIFTFAPIPDGHLLVR